VKSYQPLFWQKLSGRTKFLIFTLGLYAIISLFNTAVIVNSLSYFSFMLTKVIPVLGLVFIILFLTNLFLKPERIKKHMGKDSGLKGWFYDLIGGIIISGPPYVLYPMLGELQDNGARNGLIAAILYNRNVKIHFLPAMIYYFGMRYTVVLSIYILLFSLLNGKLLEIIVGE